MRFSIFSSAAVAAIVGFASTLRLLIAAAKAVGATEAQTASWVTAICLAKVFETGWLSWRYKMPIITAWSTAGLALIGASIGFSMRSRRWRLCPCRVDADHHRPVQTAYGLVEHIPTSVSAGMLGGILLPFALAPQKPPILNPCCPAAGGPLSHRPAEKPAACRNGRALWAAGFMPDFWER